MCLFIVLLITACNNKSKESDKTVNEPLTTADEMNSTVSESVAEITSSNQSIETTKTIESETSMITTTGFNENYNKKTNYIFGYEEDGFEGDSEDPEYKSEHYYNIESSSIVFINSKSVETKENNDYIYTLHENGYIEINKVKSLNSSVEIPERLDGYPVAYIGKEAFVGTNVKNVILNDGIMAIGEAAFSNVSSLESIILPDSLLAISANAFEYCSNLSNIKFPDSLQAIGEYSFQSCKMITEFNAPKGLRYIGFNSFLDCNNLSGDMFFYNELRTIRAGAFENTNISTVIIPNSIYDVNPRAFSGCEKLKKVVFPNKIGDSENGFGWGMFMGCISLEEVTIPENIIAILSDTFRGCVSLKEIRIPKSVEFISSHAFIDCKNLKDVYFESADCSIINNAFLFDIGVRIHAPKGGSVQKFCFLNPTIKFVPTD